MTEINDSNIKDIVKKWSKDKNLVEKEYGPISEWDVSKVTDMSSLFAGLRYFNEDISDWDVSNVTNMSDMFYIAEKFIMEV